MDKYSNISETNQDLDKLFDFYSTDQESNEDDFQLEIDEGGRDLFGDDDSLEKKQDYSDALKIKSKNIPRQLKELNQWCGWRYEVNDKNKRTKPPYSVNGRKVDVTDKDSLSSYAKVLDAYQNGAFEGLNFCLFEDDHIIGIDLDGCLDQDGHPNKFATNIVERLQSYTEISPSKTGLRIFIRSNAQITIKKPEIEIYSQKKSLSVTGHVFENYNTIEHKGAEINQLLDELNLESTKKEPLSMEIQFDDGPLTVEDKGLIDRIKSSLQGSKFEALMAGDLSLYHDDHSSADMALSAILAYWCNRDTMQMSRIFNTSELAKRDKWRKRLDYRKRTFSKVLKYNEEENALTSLDPLQVDENTYENVEEGLKKFEVTEEYAKKLGNEKLLYHNLIIKNHVITVIAQSGGGKTTIAYYHLAPELAKQGLKVSYFDNDSPASEHREMLKFAKTNNFTFYNPDANIGQSAESLVQTLNDFAGRGIDLTGHVFFFDTLKKFTTLLQKESVKSFYKLMRKMTTSGATVILLGHANKYRSKEDNTLIFEGVGDVRSDSDELIFFERARPTFEYAGVKGTFVSTVVDPEKGSKVRGVFEPLSFHISPERKINVVEEILPVAAWGTNDRKELSDDKILAVVKKCITENEEPLSKTNLIEQVNSSTGVGKNKIGHLISNNSKLKTDENTQDTDFIYTIGKNNAYYFELSSVM